MMHATIGMKTSEFAVTVATMLWGMTAMMFGFFTKMWEFSAVGGMMMTIVTLGYVHSRSNVKKPRIPTAPQRLTV